MNSRHEATRGLLLVFAAIIALTFAVSNARHHFASITADVRFLPVENGRNASTTATGNFLRAIGSSHPVAPRARTWSRAPRCHPHSEVNTSRVPGSSDGATLFALDAERSFRTP